MVLKNDPNYSKREISEQMYKMYKSAEKNNIVKIVEKKDPPKNMYIHNPITGMSRYVITIQVDATQKGIEWSRKYSNQQSQDSLFLSAGKFFIYRNS